ncbi:hypothetical protein ERE07_15470 [Allopusillimonas ginsengisoli]|nr:hypothetical protein ERE07_15470 [Allopusillimonas ginsengisoli]
MFIVVLLSGNLGACALADRSRLASSLFRASQSSVQAGHKAFEDAAADPAARRAAQEVARPWLVGRAQALSRDVTLPAVLRADVHTTLLFGDGPLDLPAIARRITAITAIPVHVRPDALLPLEAFLPRLSATGDAEGVVAAPRHADLDGDPEPLPRLLDRLCARLGVLWRYEHGRIEFYRTETRVFNVRALTLNANVQASLGQQGGDQVEGFVGTSRTQLDSGESNVMASLRARIEAFLSRAGVMSIAPDTSASIVVTDTPEVLNRIAVYLEQENRALTRRVRLVFEELVVQAHDNAEAGLNWELIFNSARSAVMAGSSSGLAAGASSLGASATFGRFSGSEAIIKALGEIGQVVRHSRVPVLTLNRRPVTHAVRTTFSYIDKVETVSLPPATPMAMPSVSVGQREQTVGSLLTLIPDAQENGLILLSVAYDNTVAQPLRSVTFGDKGNPLQLQQITIDGNGIVQQLALQPGQPVLISGFDHMRHETTNRRLNPGMPLALGGSDKVSSQQLTTVIIVTAQVEEGF